MQGQILLLFSQSKSINYYFWCLIIFIAVLHFKQQIAFCLQKYPAVQPHYFFQSVYLYKSTQTTGGDQTTEFDTTFSFTLRYVTQSFLVFSISISKKGTACLPQNQNLKKEIQLVSQSHSINTKQVLGTARIATCYHCTYFLTLNLNACFPSTNSANPYLPISAIPMHLVVSVLSSVFSCYFAFRQKSVCSQVWLGFIHRDLAQEPKIERCLMEAKNKMKMNAFMETNNLREETGKAEKHKKEPESRDAEDTKQRREKE